MLHYRTKSPQLCYKCDKLVSFNAQKCVHCGTLYPSLFGYSRMLRNLRSNFGFVTFVTYTCIALYIVSLSLDPLGIDSAAGFDFISPSSQSLFMLGATGAEPIFCWNRWWTVLSAGWLHGGLMHITFNLMWIRQLSTTANRAYGATRLTIIYILSTIISSLLTSYVAFALPGLPSILQGAQLSIGASGGVFGLLGALVTHGQHQRDLSIKQQALNYAIVLFGLGFIWGNVDNWGHLGGFLGGYVVTQLPWLNSRYPQKNSHVFAALGGSLLVIVSILLSLFHSLGISNGIFHRVCSGF